MINSRASVGTLIWARRTGGRLGGGDRLKLTVDAMLVRLNLMLRRRRLPPFSIDVASLRVPDSALCVSARELLVASSQPWLINHCLRTYLWAAIVGKNERHGFDEELLFVASMLHDLGLTDAGAQLSPVNTECFAVEGALAAQAFLQRQSASEVRVSRVAEAISLHLNVRVGLDQGIEAHLLHEGAAMDVIGSRFDEVSDDTRSGVVVRHPRLEMKSRLIDAMKHQSRTRPRSRAAFLCSRGFISLIRRSPFAS